MNRYIGACLVFGGLMALPAQADWLETFDGATPDNPFLLTGFTVDGSAPEGLISLNTSGGEGFLESTVAPVGSNGNPFAAPYGPAIITALNVTESFTDVTVTGSVNTADIVNGAPQRVDHSLFARSVPMGGYALVLDVESTLDSLSLVKIASDLSVTVLNEIDLSPQSLDGEDRYFLEFAVVGSMLTGRVLSDVGGAPGTLLGELDATETMFTEGFSGFGVAPDSTTGVFSTIRGGFGSLSSAETTVPAPAAALLLLSGLLLGRFRSKR